mgnify:CR=1 FL=1
MQNLGLFDRDEEFTLSDLIKLATEKGCLWEVELFAMKCKKMMFISAELKPEAVILTAS